jgi:ADP-L-glycero-D-manno-heptose 6-epimerase
MIVVTGGRGFIGTNLVNELEKQGNTGIMVLDTINQSLDSIYVWLMMHSTEIDVIFHFGAITDTTVMDKNLFDKYNVECSMFIWSLCTNYHIPLIYASSAATYGDGEEGFDDNHRIFNLKPLNPYGQSKQQFDLWILDQEETPPFWAGLKFFNVYGYGEKHKGNMASVAFQLYNEIITDGQVKLFKSYRPQYMDGEQKRDFIYVNDVVDICIFLNKEQKHYTNYKLHNGLYNVGTGKARSYNDLAKAVFKSLDIKEKIQYIDIPIKIRNKYQYFTEAKIDKLRNVGYDKPFHELEDGIAEYITKLKYENC